MPKKKIADGIEAQSLSKEELEEIDEGLKKGAEALHEDLKKTGDKIIQETKKRVR